MHAYISDGASQASTASSLPTKTNRASASLPRPTAAKLHRNDIALTAGVVEHPSAATGDTPCGTLFASEAPSLNTFPHGWRLASQGSATGLDSNGGLDNSKQYYFLFLQTRMTVTAFFVCGRCSS